MRAYTSCDCHNAHLLPLLNLQDLLSKELLRRRLGALRVVPRDLMATKALHGRKHAITVVDGTLVGILLLVETAVMFCSLFHDQTPTQIVL